MMKCQRIGGPHCGGQAEFVITYYKRPKSFYICGQHMPTMIRYALYSTAAEEVKVEKI